MIDHNKLVLDLYKGFLHRVPEAGELKTWVARLDGGLNLNALVETFLQSDEFKLLCNNIIPLFAPPGHFYSPIVSPEEVRTLFENPKEKAGSVPAEICIDSEYQLKVWNTLVQHLHDIPFSAKRQTGFCYYFDNPAFGHADGSILHAMLREHQPKRFIEIGSGFSSACAIDTIDKYLDGKVDVTFIEPYPKLLLDLIGAQRADKCTIHATKAQDTDLSLYESLNAGDFLFIDSTHVMKTGSDVCYELFNILPILKPGVFIHLHDIFWPFEYPKSWVLSENRSWNEIYGLRAFLMYNKNFKIEFFNDYFVRNHANVLSRDYPTMFGNSGGSLWLKKIN